MGQPLGIDQFFRFGVEDFNELAADDLTLLLRIADALEVTKELLGGIDVHHFDAQTTGEGFHDLLGFVHTQQTVIDKHAGELVSDSAMN